MGTKPGYPGSYRSVSIALTLCRDTYSGLASASNATYFVLFLLGSSYFFRRSSTASRMYTAIGMRERLDRS